MHVPTFPRATRCLQAESTVGGVSGSLWSSCCKSHQRKRGKPGMFRKPVPLRCLLISAGRECDRPVELSCVCVCDVLTPPCFAGAPGSFTVVPGTRSRILRLPCPSSAGHYGRHISTRALAVGDTSPSSSKTTPKTVIPDIIKCFMGPKVIQKLHSGPDWSGQTATLCATSSPLPA